LSYWIQIKPIENDSFLTLPEDCKSISFIVVSMDFLELSIYYFLNKNLLIFGGNLTTWWFDEVIPNIELSR